MELDLTDLTGTPVFTIRDPAPNAARVYGAQFNPKKTEWYMPAYPPFGTLVLNDLKKTLPSITLTPAADAQRVYLESVPTRLENGELPPLTFVTKPYAHQLEVLPYLYHWLRVGLLWDPGTGKTKAIVDLARLLKGKRFLIVTPKVTVLNWIEQIGIHAGTELKALPLVGTPDKKRAGILAHKSYDVLVCSYGTARNMGLPKVLPPAMKLLRAAMDSGALSKSMAQALGVQIRRLSNPDKQVEILSAKLAQNLTLPAVTTTIDAEVATTGAQWLEDMDFDVVVADESHSIKDMRSVQSKALVTLSRKASRRIIMSGTPTEGNPLHLYPQLKFLAPNLVPEDWLRYSDLFLIRAKHNQRIILGFKNLNILNQRVNRVCLQKKKEDCLDLPPRMGPFDIHFDLSTEQKKLYNTLISSMSVDLDGFFEGVPQSTLEVANAATLLNKLAQVTSGFLINSGKQEEICNGCPHMLNCVAQSIYPYTPKCLVETKPRQDVKYTKENPKLEALDELLDTLLESGEHKVIIWGVYHAELDAIVALLEKRKVGHVRVDGRTGSKIQEKITAFNNDPKIRVYVGQVATGVGITLNAASYMIYYALDWSLLTYLQSIDRNYRAGQTKKTAVYRLLGNATVDLYKAAALDQKRDFSATLTSKLSCLTCPKNVECLKNGVELFDPACIHQRSAKRKVAHAKEIEL